MAIARALAADPPVLLMDEPFGALDAITRAELRRQFRRIQRELQKTVLLVTHDIAEALSLSDRVGILDQGRLVAWDAPQAHLGFAGSAGPAVPRRPHAADPAAVFWADHRAEFAAMLQQHVLLVALSTAVAVALGVPAGIVAAHRPRLGRPLIALANIAQTIPSLALLGFLIPLPLVGGIGPRAAIVALILYALLPIVRTTASGLQGIDRAVLEAATAMGMTRRQLLTMVELPLALPSIVAGIRVATVVGVGTGHHRRLHRRRRPRRVHPPRSVDG